jgi:multidrug efflux pump subunit AcrA (membrane-fusion protein)
MAEENLSYAVLRAGMDARVVRRHVREGDLAVAGMPLLTLEDLGREVRVTVPAELEPEPRAGMEATIRTPGGARHRTVVDRVEPTTEEHVLVLYLGAGAIDRPTGSFVDVTLDSPETREAIVLPPGSLVRRGPLDGVFVISGGRAELRWLRLGEDGRVQAGIRAGERVVIDPAADLQDGAAVETIDER